MRQLLETQLGHVRDARLDEPAFDVGLRIDQRSGISHGTLTLVVGGVSVERTVSSPSCADVIAALTMMAAIAIGEEAALAPSPEQSAVAPPPGLEVQTRETPPKRPNPEQPKRTAAPNMQRREDHLRVALGAGIEVNGNRSGVFLATWFAQLMLPARFDPAFRLGVARSTTERASSSRGVIAMQWSEITFSACVDLLNERRLRVGPCVNLEAGQLGATVVAPLPARTSTYPWLTAGGCASAAWRLLPHFSVELTTGAHVPVVRPELFFEPRTETAVYRTPGVLPFGTAGIVAELP